MHSFTDRNLAARVNLPYLGRRVSLIAGADEDSDFDDSVDDSTDDGILRLEFFYGKSESREFWRNEEEDTDYFCW